MTLETTLESGAIAPEPVTMPDVPSGPCTLPDPDGPGGICGREIYARGWCRTHYLRAAAHKKGDPGGPIRGKRDAGETVELCGIKIGKDSAAILRRTAEANRMSVHALMVAVLEEWCGRR